MNFVCFQKKLKNPAPSPETPDSQTQQPNEDIEAAVKKAKGNGIGGQVHNILMDEFKKAHQKMFRNGYVESEYQHGNEKNDETRKITAVDNNEHKLEVSRWGTISGNRSTRSTVT